ncbi:hypothetical protein ANO14919_118530 [Xylariales sp. No.14919]|nr:hypothetical protein ANO14919_118530 [Xylariales sp. No.14919]
MAPAASLLDMRDISGGVAVALGVVIAGTATPIEAGEKGFFRTILFTVDAEIGGELSAQRGAFFIMAVLGMVPKGAMFSTTPPRINPASWKLGLFCTGGSSQRCINVRELSLFPPRL